MQVICTDDAVFCKPAIVRNAIGLQVTAEIGQPLAAGRTCAAREIGVYRDTATNLDGGYVSGDIYDLSSIFVPRDERKRPGSIARMQDINIRMA
jgi:hypothetical protein